MIGGCSSAPAASGGRTTLSRPLRRAKSKPPVPLIVTRVPPVAIVMAVLARELPAPDRTCAACLTACGPPFRSSADAPAPPVQPPAPTTPTRANAAPASALVLLLYCFTIACQPSTPGQSSAAPACFA